MLANRIVPVALAVSATCAAAWQFSSPAIAAEAAQRVEGPTISRVSIAPDGTGLFEGVSAPGARIALRSKGRALGRTIADGQGTWQLNLPLAFGSGEHRIEAVARTDDRGEPRIGAMIRISIPDGFGSLPDRSARPAGPTEHNLLLRAGELADRASRRFDELLPELAATDGRREPAAASAKSQPELQPVPPATSRQKVAQLDENRPAPDAGDDRPAPDDTWQWLSAILADVKAWLEASARDYQSVIVRRLSDPITTAITAPAAQMPSGTEAPPAAKSPRASQPPDAQRSAEAERLRQAEADRAAAAAQSAAAGQRAAEAEAGRRAAEAQRMAAAEKARVEAEAKRRAAAKVDAEARRKAAEAQRIATAEKARAEAEAKRRAAEEVRRQQAADTADADARRKSAEAQQPTAPVPAQPLGETRREAQDAPRGRDLPEQPLGAAKDARTALSDQQQRTDISDAGAKAADAASRPGKRGTSRGVARRNAVRRPSSDKPGSDDLCNFFRYRYPMALLDPGGWLSAGAPQRR